MLSYQPFNLLECIIQCKSHHQVRIEGHALQMQTDDYKLRQDLSALANVVMLHLNDQTLDPS